MTPKKHNIVFGIDNNYVQHLAACISSLLAHSHQEHFHFFIFSLELSTKNKIALQNWMIGERKNDVTFIDIDSNVIKTFPIKNTDYISLASYLRLFIPQFLPQGVSKALYIDSDIIFNAPISELFNIDISNYATAAVEDAPNNNPQRLGYDEKYSYFNAGFQLLNIDFLRQIDFTNRALDYIRNNPEKIILHDQDVMNALLHQNVLFLPIKWNMLDCYFIKPYNISAKYISDLKKLQRDAITIHFSGPIKPWHYGCQHPLKNLYKNYAKKIPIFSSINKWDGINKFPFRIRWMILLKLPWKWINFANDILFRIEKRLHLV